MALLLNGKQLQCGDGVKAKKYTATLSSSQYGWFTFVDENGNTLSPSKGVPLFATCISGINYYNGQFIARTNEYLFKIIDVNDATRYRPVDTSSSNLTFDMAYIESETV